MAELHWGIKMNWLYTYTPYIWPSIITACFLIALAVYSWSKRRVPGAMPLMLGCLFGTLWAVTVAMEFAAASSETKIFWFTFGALFELPIVIAITCFVIEYAWPGRWLTRRNLALLSFPWFLNVVLILTNNSYHLVWLNFSVVGSSVLSQLNMGAWLTTLYAFVILGGLNLIVFFWLFQRSLQHRWPVVLMLAGQVVGRIFFMLELTFIIQSKLPLDVMGMAFEFLMYAMALFSFHIFDPIPMAHQMVMKQLRAGILVLDPQLRIISLNPSTQAILGMPEKQILHHSIQEFLPFGDEQTQPELTEIQLETGAETRHYQLETSALNDWRGLEAGHLLLLSDITGQKQVQAKLIEQQRALAMLQEREQLARDLHDSLGQVLGYASLKMSATRKLIADGKLVKADDQLAHLESSLAEATADVREYILNLRTAPTGEKPFFSTLRNYLNGFHQNHGIHTHISIGPGMGEGVLSPDMQIQLFHILQEALSNARKHAATNNNIHILWDGR